MADKNLEKCEMCGKPLTRGTRAQDPKKQHLCYECAEEPRRKD